MQKIQPKDDSRLAAIQLFFQSFYDDRSLKDIANEFDKFRFNKLLDKDINKLKYDKKFFNELMLYIENFDINYDINKFYSNFKFNKRPFERLDIITKSILVVATSEILYNKKIKKSILINNYINISKKFLDKPDVSLINAILDKVYDKKNTT